MQLSQKQYSTAHAFQCNAMTHCLCHLSHLTPLILINNLKVVSGDYCECDNFSCDRYNGELCSGPDHGECVCGKCKCNSEWDVEGYNIPIQYPISNIQYPRYTACECKASNETCITPFGEHINKLCSGHGECECGECRCQETEEGQYSGKWCEECPTCPGKCEELKACVQCQVFQSGELTRMDDGMGGYICTDEDGMPKCDFKSIVVPKAEDMVNADERTCTFIDDDDCRFTFVYGYKNETGELQVRTMSSMYCTCVVHKFYLLFCRCGFKRQRNALRWWTSWASCSA